MPANTVLYECFCSESLPIRSKVQPMHPVRESPLTGVIAGGIADRSMTLVVTGSFRIRVRETKIRLVRVCP